MTALAGYWDLGRGEEPAGACARMLKGQAIYGREDSQWASRDVALGRRLFARLPEDRLDRGPVVGAGGEMILVADVRIDNRGELAEGLGLTRAHASGLSDAGLLMRAFEHWDEETVLRRLVGDFALALWQPERQRLLLARDFVGRAPLHYHVGGGFFAFASMPKGLHALPAIPRCADLDQAAEFVALTHGIGDSSFYAGIKRVEAGHAVAVTREAVSVRRYWEPDLSPILLPSAGDYAEALRERLDEAVASRLRGAGEEVAAQLSAGLDSSAVAATAARQLAARGGRVAAFTAVPAVARQGDPSGAVIEDEGPLAAETAARYPNMDHVLVRTGERSLLETLDRNVFLYDRPRLNLCNQLWLDAIKDEAKRRRLTVMLTGDTGNLGMSYSGMHLLPELLGGGRLLSLARELAALSRAGMRTRTLANATLSTFLPESLRRAISARRDPAARTLGRSSDEARRRLFFRPRADGLEARLFAYRLWDSAMHNKGTLAGWGIDLREPTADRRLVEFCLRVPLDQYLRGGTTRALARAAFADRLPAAVLNETRRGYQASDWHVALERDRKALEEEATRLADLPEAAGVLDFERLRSLLDHWPDDWRGRRVTADYRFGLLRAISAGHFLRRASGSNH